MFLVVGCWEGLRERREERREVVVVVWEGKWVWISWVVEGDGDVVWGRWREWVFGRWWKEG